MPFNGFKHIVRNCIEWDIQKFRKHGCISYKEDGIRGFYYPGESDLWSRDMKPIRGCQHIVKELQGFSWPVDMELTVPDMEFNELSGIIRNHNETPEVLAGIIDIVKPGCIRDRLKFRPEESEHIHHIPHYRVQSLHSIHKHYHKALFLGYEGIVWKSFSHEYENKRNWHWMRMVPIHSEDCECLGVYEGNGKMQGIAGGIYIDFNGIKCKVGTMKGLTYEDRWELLDNEEAYIGVMAEIHYKELQPSGKPRQPRFKGWRWDK